LVTPYASDTFTDPEKKTGMKKFLGKSGGNGNS